MNRRVITLAVSLLILGFGTTGCGEGAGRWTTNGKAPGRKVLRLRLGTSIEDVRAKLGTPEALEIYRNAPHKEESLWYGNGRWKLDFTDGALEGRYK
jgi:hypothetical protein